ncbi:MAG TPA: Hsp20/alpha crystallin family protein [Thermodesulfovibrionales bacterium]|nr:Hsp20/alpha crystallin family protein [Thermodesulfovibrionales bacterium]
MAGYKGTTALAKTERPRYLSPLEDMERWFADFWRKPFSLLTPTLWPEKAGEFETIVPSVDIYEEGNEIVLKADMPGMEKKDVDISISDGFLTISGERKKEEKVEKGNYYSYERSHGSFFRRFELPRDIDADKVKAHLDSGVLEVRLPKSEEAKERSKKISIS